MTRPTASRAAFLVALGVALAPAWAAAEILITPEEGANWVLQSGGGLNALRLLEEDAHLYDSPSGGMIVRLGSQVLPVKLTDGRTPMLGRMNLTVGMGFQWVKFLIIADATRLSPDFFAHSGSYEIAMRSQNMVALPITITEDISITPGIRYDQKEREDQNVSDQSQGYGQFLVRARLGGLKGVGFFDKNGAPTFQLGFAPFQFLDLVSGDLGAILLASLGNPEVLFHRYQPGNSPYRLIATEAPLEDNYGLRWETPDFLIPRGLASATVLVAPQPTGLTWRRLELSWNQTIKLLDFRLLGAYTSNSCIKLMCNPLAGFMWLFGFGAPGATLLVLNTSAFAVNMDDAPRWGFTASVRIQFISNNKRLSSKGKEKTNEMLLFHEGEEAERVNVYFEGRVSRNDFASLRGVPFPDVTTVGFWFGSEDLDLDPRTPGIARAQRDALNEILDSNPDFEPDERRRESWHGLRESLAHPVPGSKADQRFY